MPYTYMVRCADNTYYTGWAQDVERRVLAHNSGKGAKYTRGRLPVALVWSRFYEDKRQAQRLEVKIKALTRRQKEALISGKLNVQAGPGDNAG